jgi:hypothetical protein
MHPTTRAIHRNRPLKSHAHGGPCSFPGLSDRRDFQIRQRQRTILITIAEDAVEGQPARNHIVRGPFQPVTVSALAGERIAVERRTARQLQPTADDTRSTQLNAFRVDES